MNLKLVFTAALVVLVLVFAVQNAAVVEIRLLFWHVSFPRSLLIILMLLAGFLIGWVGRGVVLSHKKTG